MTIDPLIARLDALAEAATPGPWEVREDIHGGKEEYWCHWHSVGPLELAGRDADPDGRWIAALVTAWPEIRARLAALSTVTDAMVDAALAAEDEAMDQPGYSERSMMRAAIRAAYDAANAKGTAP